MAAAISSISASGVAAVSAAVQVPSTQNVKAQATSGANPAALKNDTVKLSLGGNIKLMHQQGLSASLIASRLGVPLKQVELYLPGLTSAVAPTAVAAVSSTAGEGKK